MVAAIANDLDRETWVKAGMAIYSAGGSYDLFLDFSRRSPNHRHEATVQRRWRSFEKSPPRRINGVTTLRWLAAGNR